MCDLYLTALYLYKYVLGYLRIDDQVNKEGASVFCLSRAGCQQGVCVLHLSRAACKQGVSVLRLSRATCKQREVDSASVEPRVW